MVLDDSVMRRSDSLKEMMRLARSLVSDGVVTLYGNVPIRGEGVIDRAVELLERSGCDSAR